MLVFTKYIITNIAYIILRNIVSQAKENISYFTSNNHDKLFIAKNKVYIQLYRNRRNLHSFNIYEVQ